MVRTEGADKRSTARFLAFGVNGLSVALMIVVFAHTAGVTGAEAGIAGGSAVLGQKLLEAVFGDQAVRYLAERARRSLEERVRALLDEERVRYLALIDALELQPGAPSRCARRHVGSTTCVSLRSQSHDDEIWKELCDTLLEGARRLLTRGTDIGVRIEGLETAAQAARGRLDDGLVDEAEAVAKKRSRPAPAVGRAHRGRHRRGDRVGQVVDVQRADRAGALARRRTPSHHVVGQRLRLGERGCRGAAGVARHPAAPPDHARLDARHPSATATTTSTVWSCSTCPTTTPPRSPTTSRSTGWCSSPTCWCGCSTRRSTPTPRSTSATSPGCPTTPRSWWSCSTTSTPCRRTVASRWSTTYAACSPPTGCSRCRSTRSVPATASASTSSAPRSLVAWPARSRPRPGSRPISRSAAQPSQRGQRHRQARARSAIGAWPTSRTRSPTPPGCRRWSTRSSGPPGCAPAAPPAGRWSPGSPG